ncbi:MAG: DUF1573 domain-containing protein [Ignavibacteriae bacterium]|nr:DUF1573 domain-containing protein [Ignavibacteriota bacterium]
MIHAVPGSTRFALRPVRLHFVLMRPLMVLLVLSCLLPGYAAGQGLIFDSTTHDFGRVKQREKVRATFRYTNAGTDTVYLLEPRAGCGCTAALLSAPMVTPKGTGSMSVDFTAYAGTFGHVEKHVQMFRRVPGGEQQIATLTIKAFIVGEVIPDSTLLRFDVTEGDSAVMHTALHNSSDHPVTLDNVSAALMEYVDTTAGTAYHSDRVIGRAVPDVVVALARTQLEPGESTELSIGLRTHGKGQVTGSVRIVLPQSEIRVPVVGIVRRLVRDPRRE